MVTVQEQTFVRATLAGMFCVFLSDFFYSMNDTYVLKTGMVHLVLQQIVQIHV
jgi:hypothetical protein